MYVFLDDGRTVLQCDFCAVPSGGLMAGTSFLHPCGAHREAAVEALRALSAFSDGLEERVGRDGDTPTHEHVYAVQLARRAADALDTASDFARELAVAVAEGRAALTPWVPPRRGRSP